MKLLENGVNAQARMDAGRLHLQVSVDDASVRQKHAGFNGYERVFALVPEWQAGRVVWQRHDLRYRGSWSYSGSSRAGGTRQPTYDNHGASLQPRSLDPRTISELGIAFGMDTNVGTLWLQTADDNYQPTWR